jgi:hypothetical protein
MVLSSAVACLASFLRAEDPKVAPAFEKLEVTIEPFPLDSFRQVEQLEIQANGRCWYRVEAAEAQGKLAERSPAVIGHQLSASQIERLNKRLERTDWLNAEGAEGRAAHTHPTKVTITLTRDGKTRTIVCQGERPEPYAALLHAIYSLSLQERRIYLHNYVRGDVGADAWAEIGRELAALRGDPYGKPVFDIDYERYLPIARDDLHPFYVQNDDELIPAVRLIGHFKVHDELATLHHMAHDRSSNLRREVAWALGRIHDASSLPVLASMMSAPANVEAAGPGLIGWGEAATPYIVELIAKSTDGKRARWENTVGEDMVRAYLARWDKLEQPIDTEVVAAVRSALAQADPQNGAIRTTYHKEFLQRLQTKPPGGKQ